MDVYNNGITRMEPMLEETIHLRIHGTLPPDCFTLSKGSVGEKAVLSGRLFFAFTPWSIENNLP